MIIYKIENKINGKIYIGQTIKSLNQRIAGHLEAKSHIGNSLRKYGLQYFDISVIDTADDKETLLDKEIEYINFYDSRHPNGYNIVEGGAGGDSITNNPNRKEILIKIKNGTINAMNRPEVKEKMKRNKEIQNRPEVRAKNSESQKRNWKDPEIRAKYVAGIIKAQNRPEVKAAKSARHKNKYISKEIREKQSKIQKKRFEDPLEREKLSKGQKKRFEDPLVREKHRLARLGKKRGPYKKKGKNAIHS